MAEIRIVAPEELPQVRWAMPNDERWVAWRRADIDEGRLLVIAAFLDGRAVGVVGFDTASRELTHLAVDEPLRRQGIGAGLVAAVERAAADRGVAEIWLGSYKEHPETARWYERLGYRIAGERLDEWDEPLPDGGVFHHDEPCWVMTKEL